MRNAYSERKHVALLAMSSPIAPRFRVKMAAALALLTVLPPRRVMAWPWTTDDDSLERVRRAGVLRVGYSIEAPFVTLDADGSVVGQSAACAAEVARALGVGVEWVQTALDRQIPDLLDGRFDVVGAGLFVTSERAAQVRFSVPTLRVRPAWLTRAVQPEPTLAALRGGWNVAVVSGSVAERHLAALGLGARLHRVPDNGTGVAGLRRGLYDALAVPWPVGRNLAKDVKAEMKVWAADDGRPTRLVALAFRPADQALAEAANTALRPWLRGSAYLELLTGLGLTADDLPLASDTAR